MANKTALTVDTDREEKAAQQDRFLVFRQNYYATHLLFEELLKSGTVYTTYM